MTLIASGWVRFKHEAFCFCSSSVKIDSLVFQNLPERKYEDAIGQILPIIAMIPLVGIAQYSDPKQWAGLVIIIIFIGLYASQQKHLVK